MLSNIGRGERSRLDSEERQKKDRESLLSHEKALSSVLQRLFRRGSCCSCITTEKEEMPLSSLNTLSLKRAAKYYPLSDKGFHVCSRHDAGGVVKR